MTENRALIRSDGGTTLGHDPGLAVSKEKGELYPKPLMELEEIIRGGGLIEILNHARLEPRMFGWQPIRRGT